MRQWRFAAIAAAALAGTAWAVPQPGPAVPPPPASQDETLDYARDRLGRMTLPVMLGERGPFRFIVDTGAERTVVSHELAQALQLAPGGEVTLASLGDVRQVPTAIIPRLRLGRRDLERIRAPLLLERHLGADGMLGVDALADQRVTFDFDRGEIGISPSQRRTERWPADTIVVRGQTRLGRFVLADVRLEGQRVFAIVDTGVAISIGNPALLHRLVESGRLDPGRVVALTSVTGAQFDVRYTRTRRLRISGAEVNDLPIAFADLPVFRELELTDRPALLLGMDVLRLFRRVSIDFGTRRLHLLAPPRADARRFRSAGTP